MPHHRTVGSACICKAAEPAQSATRIGEQQNTFTAWVVACHYRGPARCPLMTHLRCFRPRSYYILETLCATLQVAFPVSSAAHWQTQYTDRLSTSIQLAAQVAAVWMSLVQCEHLRQRLSMLYAYLLKFNMLTTSTSGYASTSANISGQTIRFTLNTVSLNLPWQLNKGRHA